MAEMTSALKIIGSEKHNGIDDRGKAFWLLEKLDNAFYFFMPAMPDTEPLFVEFDELTASSAAYKERGPLHMLDMLENLEELHPGFSGVEVSDNIKLVRQRWSKSSGLSLEIDGKTTCFMKNSTLETINFLDFYNDFLDVRN